jgi:hypothetical protein
MNQSIFKVASTLGKGFSTADRIGRSVATEAVSSWGKGVLSKPQIFGALAGAGYGAATADYRRGPGNGIGRAAMFGAGGFVGGSAYRLGRGMSAAGVGRIADAIHPSVGAFGRDLRNAFRGIPPIPRP